MKRVAPYVAVVIFLGCGCLGYLTAGRIAYQYGQSNWFRSLGKQDAEELRQNSRTLITLGLSSLSIQNTSLSLQNNLRSLAEIRSTARQELLPIIDLRLAKDYAMMARLDLLAGNQKATDEHQQAAKRLLLSLGWSEVSDKAVTDLAEGQLHSRLKQ